MDLQTKAEIERLEKRIPAKREYKCVFRLQASGTADPTTTLLWEDISEVVPGFEVPQFERVTVGYYRIDVDYRNAHPFWSEGDQVRPVINNCIAAISTNAIDNRTAMIINSEEADINVFNYGIGYLVAGTEAVNEELRNIHAQGVALVDGLDSDLFSGGVLCVLTYYPEAQ